MRIALAFGVLALLTSRVLAAPPTDKAGFTDYMRGLLQSRAAPGQQLTSDKPLHIAFRNGGATVDVEFGPVYRTCADKPEDCERRVSEFVDLWAQQYGPMAPPDKAKIYASVWLERNFPLLVVQSAGSDPVMAKFKGHIWIVCMNSGRPLPRSALTVLGMNPHEAVETCTRNTIAAQAPFEASIADMPRGQIRKIAAESEGVLVLMHDLWAPVAKRFDGELTLCVASSNTVYYARGASTPEVAAIEERAKEDAAEATAAADHRPSNPGDFRFDVLRWTDNGWDIVN
jgi:hypothetical protein